jgi:GT2 family glycosyltransferase
MRRSWESFRARTSIVSTTDRATSGWMPGGGAAPKGPGRVLPGSDVLSFFEATSDARASAGESASPAREEELARGCSVVVCTYLRPQSLLRCLESVKNQGRRPDEVLIVDASPSGQTEESLRMVGRLSEVAPRLLYYRVSEAKRGLTRQRNFALRRVAYDLVAFLDDDVVLEQSCLAEMERVHRLFGDRVVGVGAMVANEAHEPGLLWRVRRRLHIVGDLTPGTYTRSGLSIPWFAGCVEGLAEGDWLPGCAMMWKTARARDVGFHEGFAGYAQGEDLDFSLRARCCGALVMASAARVQHLHEVSGRPDHFRLGYMTIYNRYQIHRRGLSARSWWDVAWFVYAWTLDSLMFCRHLLFPKRWKSTFRHLAGRLAAVVDLSRCR